MNEKISDFGSLKLGTSMNLGIPARGLAFIRHIETLDRYPGSEIYLTQKSQEKIAEQQFDVVAVGGYEFCDDEDCERQHVSKQMTGFGVPQHFHSVRVGDWVLCRKRSWMATPDPSVYCVRIDDILGVFREQ